MNSRLASIGLIAVILLSGCLGGGSAAQMEMDDYTLGEASCEAEQSGETTVEKKTDGENTLLEIDGSVKVNGEYYELTTPDLRQTSGGEYELYVESRRAQERTEVCTAYIPYTITIDLGTNGGDTSKMTLYHDGKVRGKILPENMDEGNPVVVGN